VIDAQETQRRGMEVITIGRVFVGLEENKKTKEKKQKKQKKTKGQASSLTAGRGSCRIRAFSTSKILQEPPQ
jgi:hypothetical protein